MTEPSDSSNKPEFPTETPETSSPQQPAPGGYYAPQGQPPPGYPPQGYAPGAYPGTYPPPPGAGYLPPPGTGYPPAGYPPPPPYTGYDAPAAPPRNGLGIAALITGVLSLPAAFTVVGGFVLGVVAVILGFLGYRRSRSGEATNGGMAIGGIVLGVLGIIVSAVFIAVGVWGFNQFGGHDLVDCLQQAGSDSAAQQQCEQDFKGNLEDRLSITLTPIP